MKSDLRKRLHKHADENPIPPRLIYNWVRDQVVFGIGDVPAVALNDDGIVVSALPVQLDYNNI